MRKSVFCCLVLLGATAVTASGTEAERGKALYVEGDYESASRIFEDILGDRPDDEDALHYLGKIRFDHSDLDAAKKYLEKLVEVSPNNADYQLALATVYSEKARTSGFFLSKKKWAGRWKERLELAHDLDPQNLEVREWLSAYLLNAPGIGGGDKDRGTRIARETIELDEVFGRLMLGYAYRKSDMIDLAIQEYAAVLDLDPEKGRAYVGLGFCHLTLEDLEEAEANFEEAMEVSPDDEVSYEAMAHYWSKRGAVKAQAENQERLLQLTPLNSDVRYDLARNYRDRDMAFEAIAHYEQLLLLTPKHHKAGDAKKELKKLKEPFDRRRPR